MYPALKNWMEEAMSAFTDWLATRKSSKYSFVETVAAEDGFKAGLEAAAKVCEEMHEREDDNCGEAANCIHAMKEG